MRVGLPVPRDIITERQKMIGVYNHLLRFLASITIRKR